MRLYIDVDTLQFIDAPNRRTAASYFFKRGDSTNLELQFCRDGAGLTGLSGYTIIAGLKADNQFTSATYLAYADSFPTSDTGGFFAADFDLNTAALSAALGTAESIVGQFEVQWTVGGRTQSTRLNDATIQNDVIRGSEVSVTYSAPAYPIPDKVVASLYEYTSLTGGAATALDIEPTLNRNAGRLVVVRLATSAANLLYRLTAGTEAESVPWVIRPDDYAASTNEKYWAFVGAWKQGVPLVPNIAGGNSFHRVFVDTTSGTPQLTIEATEALT
jgi:hypothetical protein